MTIGIRKAEMLQQMRLHRPADDHVMVGNDPRWRFIREHDFAGGMR